VTLSLSLTESVFAASLLLSHTPGVRNHLRASAKNGGLLCKSYVKNLTPPRPLILTLCSLFVLAILWRVYQTNNAVNLLANSNFDSQAMTGWQMNSQPDIPPSARVSMVDATNRALILNIPATKSGSWVGVGQRVAVEPNQYYQAQLHYHLSDDTAKVVLRLSQFGADGRLLAEKDTSSAAPHPPPTPPESGGAGGGSPESGGAGGAVWQFLSYNFITNEATTEVEIAGALVGQSATEAHFDDFALTVSPDHLTALKQDRVIWGLALLILVALAYTSPLSRRFTSRFKAESKSKDLDSVIAATMSNKRLLLMVAVNVALFFIFAEIMAVTLYFIQGDGLFYSHKKMYALIQEDKEGKLTEVRIHPYFGFAGSPGWERQHLPVYQTFWDGISDVKLNTVNNHGLYSNHDYPFNKTKSNQFIIAIFGGSVAEEFALVGQPYLIKALQASPFFANKEVIILNFSYPGYKQPQQLLLLNYFSAIGQKFDLVVNIDGFNEVALSNENNRHQVDLSMPQIGAMNTLVNLSDQTTLTPRRLEALVAINRDKAVLNQLAAFINQNYLASLNFALEKYYAYRFNDYQATVHDFQDIKAGYSEASLLFVKPSDFVLADDVLYQQIADQWATSSMMMYQFLATQHVPYFHFMQPNQYFSHKKMGEVETKIALNENQPYRAAIMKGYPILQQRFDSLQSIGVHFYSAIEIFDHETRPTYRDDCCHYSKLGTELLAQFVAQAIIKELGIRN